MVFSSTERKSGSGPTGIAAIEEIARLRNVAKEWHSQHLNLNQFCFGKVNEALELLMTSRGAGDKELLEIKQRQTTYQHVMNIKRTFTDFDLDFNGYLDFEEFTDACVAFGIDGTQAEMRDLFTKLDTDKNGKIDEEEFILGILDFQPSVWSLQTQLNELLEEILYTTEKMASDQDMIERLLIENSSAEQTGTGKLKLQKDGLLEENEELHFQIDSMTKELRKFEERLMYIKDDIVDSMLNICPEIAQRRPAGMMSAVFSEDESLLNRHLEKLFNQEAMDSGFLSFEGFCECWRTLGLHGTQDEVDACFGNLPQMTKLDFFNQLKKFRQPEIIIQAYFSRFVNIVKDLKTNAGVDVSLSTEILQTLTGNVDTLQSIRGIVIDTDEELIELYKTLQHIFNTCDTENSGRIKLSGFRQALLLLRQYRTPQQAEELFQRADSSGIDSISWPEFFKVIMNPQSQVALLKLLLKKLSLVVQESCVYFEREKKLWNEQGDKEGMKRRYQNLLARTENQEEFRRHVQLEIEKLRDIVKVMLGPVGGQSLDVEMQNATSILADSVQNDEGSHELKLSEFISLYQSIDPEIDDDQLRKIFDVLSNKEKEVVSLGDLKYFLETQEESKITYMKLQRITSSLKEFQAKVEESTKRRREKRREAQYVMLRDEKENETKFFEIQELKQTTMEEIDKLKRKLDVCPDQEATTLNRQLVDKIAYLKNLLEKQQITKEHLCFIQKQRDLVG